MRGCVVWVSFDCPPELGSLLHIPVLKKHLNQIPAGINGSLLSQPFFYMWHQILLLSMLYYLYGTTEIVKLAVK